jgi:lysine biosynthesis protein LysW
MPECPVCGATVDLKEDTVEGELIACADCGSELEVTGENNDQNRLPPLPHPP